MPPWRFRCPMGHTSIRIYSETYRCESCGVTYEGEPIDATEVDEFPIDEAARPESREKVDDDEVLEALVDVCQDPTRTWAKSRDLDVGHSRQIGIALARLHEDGLVRREGGRQFGYRWRPTATGFERVQQQVSPAQRATLTPLEHAVLVGLLGALVLLVVAVRWWL